MGHLSEAQHLAAGLRTLPEASRPFAAAQAAWRFYANPRMTMPQLGAPLIEAARAGVAETCKEWALVVLDWSLLHYGGHASKEDRITLAHRKDLGYELLTALVVGDRHGQPLAPACLELRARDGLHTTRHKTPLRELSALDGLEPVMAHVEGLGLGRPLVYVIDREADSVGHLRHWVAAGRHFVVRADDERYVLHAGQEQKLIDVARQVPLVQIRSVTAQGSQALQFVGETGVVLHRPARTHRIVAGQAQHRNIPGAPLELRLIVSEIRDENGCVLARWLLLSNLPAQVSAATVALWYYWRWRIESYHKLLKGAGQQVESWLQDDAEQLARRLTVAAMAGVVVWQLARDDQPASIEMRRVLVRLSGRLMKRGKGRRDFTEPALLAGLGVLLSMLHLLEQYSLDELKGLAHQVLPRMFHFHESG